MGSNAAATLRAIKTDLAAVGPMTANAHSELMERLAALERRVGLMIARQPDATTSDHPLRGLSLSHEQAVGLLDRGALECWSADHEPLPLGRSMRSFAGRCGLDTVDIDLLVAALAPDVDPRFEKLYGFIHDDMTKRRATIGLAMQLCGLAPSSARDRERFSTSALLLSNALVVIDDEGPFLGRALSVPDHVAATLLGGCGLEPSLERLSVEPVVVEAPEIPAVRSALDRTRLLHLTEGVGGAAVHVAACAAHEMGVRPLIVDVSSAHADELAAVVAATLRHRALTGDIVILRPAEDLAERAPRGLERIAAMEGPVVLVGSKMWDPAWSPRSPHHIQVGELTQHALGDIWTRSLGAAPVASGAVEDVRSSFRMTPEQIVRAARSALFRVGTDAAEVGFAELSTAARAQSASGLDRLARRLEPTAGWSDLILPNEVSMLLRELALRVRWREQVMQQWELGRGWRGRGIAALFAGPSGTGKTTAAEVIAKDLGYDIHVVDLSSVVDKYIGETEKKLEVIFTEAERTNTVLLFDEADAIFGKRSEVKDARDRYANIEVSYLLQRIERFAGLAILTTNLGANLDEAFTRRLDVVVDFPRPDAPAREQLWRHEFRPTVPTDNIDFDFCATAFDLTGGNIRNIVITAAYLAAEAQRAVSMADVVAAVQREYRKMGRLCLASEFGVYAALLR